MNAPLIMLRSGIQWARRLAGPWRFHACLAACILSLLPAAGIAASGSPLAACPQIPLFKARFQTVAESMDFNGLPLSIRRFDSADDPSQILAFYRGVWAGSEKIPGPIEYKLGDWQVIATSRGGCFYTVQVMAGAKKGSTGFLGVSSVPSKEVVKPEIPTMTGSTILNDITHNDDGGKTARTVLLTNGFSPGANAVFYKNALTGKGWQALSGHEMTTRTGRGSVMIFKNGLQEVSVTAMRDGSDNTQVLLNFVDRP